MPSFLQVDVLRRGGVRAAGAQPGGGGEGRHGAVGARITSRGRGVRVGRGAGAPDGGRGECHGASTYDVRTEVGLGARNIKANGKGICNSNMMSSGAPQEESKELSWKKTLRIFAFVTWEVGILCLKSVIIMYTYTSKGIWTC